MNGYSDVMHVENIELSKSSKSEHEARSSEAGDESRCEPEIDVMYTVDESPPLSLCLLLGFQVSCLPLFDGPEYRCLKYSGLRCRDSKSPSPVVSKTILQYKC